MKTQNRILSSVLILRYHQYNLFMFYVFLISYLSGRTMVMDYNGDTSNSSDLPGGGPQGSTTGLLEYKSQTNNNCDFVPPSKRYKWVDDLSILEMVNLISAGISSYNFNLHVASDIGVNQSYLPSENICTQSYMDRIGQWTNDNQMKVNGKKTDIDQLWKKYRKDLLDRRSMCW